MYEVVKVLNNNTILAHKDTEEVIIMYKGIVLVRRQVSILKSQVKLKTFNAKKLSNQNNVHDIINYIEPVYLEIAY